LILQSRARKQVANSEFCDGRLIDLAPGFVQSWLTCSFGLLVTEAFRSGINWLLN